MPIPLTKRKEQLLVRLIEEYIRTAAPVSSSSLTRFMKVSSATIRSELKDLEELGFLRRPHTASGCGPTSQAYRFYVNMLLSKVTVDIDEVRILVATFRMLGNEIEKLITRSLDELTASSGYLAFITLPKAPPFVVRSFNLIEVDFNQLMIVVVTDLGVTQSPIIRTEVPVRKLMLGHLNERLTNLLRGRNLASLRTEEIHRALEDFSVLPVSVQTRLEKFLCEIAPAESSVIFSDAFKLLTQPEFYAVERFRQLIDSVTDEELFLETLDERKEVDLGAIIGEESGQDGLIEASILFSDYQIGGEASGRVGVVGPTRLYYSRTLPLVLHVAKAMSQVIDEWRRGRDDD
ncbi:MAG: heat-inducible transcription repressor HrcA [Candidatus Riflebacteria bacterium RBG_13_59_9]|nr:MAG: heat-inducible transcription repressor HrcA [Candidatus Riflebacteria bacterium RBG_13_59_9]